MLFPDARRLVMASDTIPGPAAAAEAARMISDREVDLLIGNPAKARERLGWVPKVGFEELVQMMVDQDLAEQKVLAGLTR